jgi:hypothetical protein
VASRAEQLAKNEALFREINERIGETSEDWALESIAALCECGNRGCSETIELSAGEYEAVRAHGDHFVLVPGHEDLSVERIVETAAAHLVVEKVGEGAQIARRLDPRAG